MEHFSDIFLANSVKPFVAIKARGRLAVIKQDKHTVSMYLTAVKHALASMLVDGSNQAKWFMWGLDARI